MDWKPWKKGKNLIFTEPVRGGITELLGVAIKSALKRLSKKGKIVSFHKGFYLIISAQYANRGILPAVLFQPKNQGSNFSE